MTIIDRTNPRYNKLIEINTDSYKIKAKQLDNDEEIECPLDRSMKVCKKNGKIVVKKKSLFHPF